MKPFPYCKKNVIVRLNHYTQHIKIYKRLRFDQMFNIMIQYTMKAIRNYINKKTTYHFLLLMFNLNIVNKITEYLTRIPTQQERIHLYNDIIQFNILSYLIIPSSNQNITQIFWYGQYYQIPPDNDAIGYDLYGNMQKMKGEHRHGIDGVMCNGEFSLKKIKITNNIVLLN